MFGLPYWGSLPQYLAKVPWNKGLSKEDPRAAAYSEKLAQINKGKTYEEIHGIEKAKELRAKKALPRKLPNFQNN